MFARRVQIGAYIHVEHAPLCIGPTSLGQGTIGGEIGNDTEGFRVAPMFRQELGKSVGLTAAINGLRCLAREFVEVAFLARKRCRCRVTKSCGYGDSRGRANDFSRNVIGVTEPVSEQLAELTQAQAGLWDFDLDVRSPIVLIGVCRAL